VLARHFDVQLPQAGQREPAVAAGA